MRKIKGSSSYLKNQVRKNLAKCALSLSLFGLIIFVLTSRILSTLQVGPLEEAILLLSLVPLISFYFYLRKYRIYKGGWTGEKQVVETLMNKLNDDYYILNDLYLQEGGGDIDHIVLGPNGVFVLETKNWSGTISSNGDEWYRMDKRNFSSSPSRQVKRNAAKIKRIIDSNPNLRALSIRVEGIVVFTNTHAVLHLNNSTVSILKLTQLSNYITTFSRSKSISNEQLKEIGKEIVLQRH
jgi:hypothetical protein